MNIAGTLLGLGIWLATAVLIAAGVVAINAIEKRLEERDGKRSLRDKHDEPTSGDATHVCDHD